MQSCNNSGPTRTGVGPASFSYCPGTDKNSGASGAKITRQAVLTLHKVLRLLRSAGNLLPPEEKRYEPNIL